MEKIIQILAVPPHKDCDAVEPDVFCLTNYGNFWVYFKDPTYRKMAWKKIELPNELNLNINS
ncbi:MAG: hypothetical protein M1308_11815 [Actinobacteria bacterium]|nr:hypothetical protein [Actinomycetota bacterium]